MVKLNNFGQPQPNQQTNFNQNAQFQSNQSQTQSQFPEQPAQNQSLNNQLAPQKGLFQIPEKFLQLIPWIPVGLEMLTGQKIPPVGVLADILSGIQQVQFTQQQILNSQQQLWTKLESLENNASNQLTNLSQQITSANKSFHLLATETKKSLEFNPRPKPELERNSYEETETY